MKIIKVLTFLSITFLFFSPGSSRAQNSVAVFISQSGELSFNVQKPTFSICISQKGEIAGYSILANGPISYDIHERVQKIGEVNVSYNIHGRIERIDNEEISFDLHNRLNEIGVCRITYDIHNRLESVGKQKISYDIHGRVENISM
jgi:hypothetical protein